MAKRVSQKGIKNALLRLDKSRDPVYVRIVSPMFMAQAKKWMNVINLETGEKQRVLVRTVLGSAMRDHYQNDTYVGKDFMIQERTRQDGKSYYTYSISEIALNDEQESLLALRIATKEREKSSEPLTQETSQDMLLAATLRDDYPKYLKSRRWKKIRDRVWARDEKTCARCGGQATEVHHRSYSDDVILGKDDEKLASICEGCHNVIHFDEKGKKRQLDDPEIDVLLSQRDTRNDFPFPRIDLRKRNQQHPAEWERLNAVQRLAYRMEEQRQCESRRREIRSRKSATPLDSPDHRSM